MIKSSATSSPPNALASGGANAFCTAGRLPIRSPTIPPATESGNEAAPAPKTAPAGSIRSPEFI